MRFENRFDSGISYKSTVINSNFVAGCKTDDKLMSVGNRNVHERTHLRPSHQSSVKCVVKNNIVKHVWVNTGKVFTTVGYQWKPTGRKFTVGSNGLVDNIANPRCTLVSKWIPTGRTISLGSDHLKPKVISPNSEMPTTSDVSMNDVCDNLVFSNQTKPNCSWGSMFFSYPFWSDFKCRSYKSSCGIWTQAALNI